MAGAGLLVLLTEEAATASWPWGWADGETVAPRDVYSSSALEEGGKSQGRTQEERRWRGGRRCCRRERD